MGCRNARRVKLSVGSARGATGHKCRQETIVRAQSSSPNAKSPGWWARASRQWILKVLLDWTGSGIQHRLGAGGFGGSGDYRSGRRRVRPGPPGNVVGGRRANAGRSPAGGRNPSGGAGADASRCIADTGTSAADDSAGVRNRVHDADGGGDGRNSGDDDRLRALLDSARGIISRSRDARSANDLDVRRHVRSPGRDGRNGGRRKRRGVGRLGGNHRDGCGRRRRLGLAARLVLGHGRRGQNEKSAGGQSATGRNGRED